MKAAARQFGEERRSRLEASSSRRRRSSRFTIIDGAQKSILISIILASCVSFVTAEAAAAKVPQWSLSHRVEWVGEERDQEMEWE